MSNGLIWPCSGISTGSSLCLWVRPGKASHLLGSAPLSGGLWPADCWAEVFQDLPQTLQLQRAITDAFMDPAVLIQGAFPSLWWQILADSHCPQASPIPSGVTSLNSYVTYDEEVRILYQTEQRLTVGVWCWPRVRLSLARFSFSLHFCLVACSSAVSCWHLNDRNSIQKVEKMGALCCQAQVVFSPVNVV